MTYWIFTTCLLITICQCSRICASETVSELVLKQKPRSDEDSEKGPVTRHYIARISNATADPQMLSFLTDLSTKFGKIPADKYNILDSLTINQTKLIAEQARQLEQIATDVFTISNCELNDEVANSLSRIRCRKILSKNLKLSDAALSTLLNSPILRSFAAEEIRGCTAEGWRGLAHKSIGVSLTDCDFTDEAFRHLSECTHIELRNAQITDIAMESLKKHKLETLALSGCPITNEGLQKLRELPELSKLDLSRTSITDESLQKLPKMPKLTHLDLSETAITNEGFHNFFVPPDLHEIRLTGTKVTSAWGIEFTRQHHGSNPADKLRVDFLHDPRCASS